MYHADSPPLAEFVSVVSAERAKRLHLTAIRTRMRFVERVLRANLYLSPRGSWRDRLRGAPSSAGAPRYLKIRFESAVTLREPYLLELADTRGLLHGESSTSRDPPLGSIGREELCRAYGEAAYLRQRQSRNRIPG